MKQYSYEEMDQLVRFIFHTRKQIQDRIHHPLYVGEASVLPPGSHQLCDCIEWALQACSKENRLFLQQEYLAGNDKGWWHGYYSRSTYYRVKRRAMCEFLHCLDV